MGTQAEPRQDYFWVEDREPHFQRRKDILESHPEVTKLFGTNPKLKYVTVALVIAQLTIALFIHRLSWFPVLQLWQLMPQYLQYLNIHNI